MRHVLLAVLLVTGAVQAEPLATCYHDVDKVMYDSNIGFLCGVDQKGGPLVVTPSTPSRTLNSNFTPSSTNPTFVSYSINISCSMSLAGGQTSTVQLLSDTAGTPTTSRARATNGNSGTLVVGVAITNNQTIPLTYIVPAGHNVRLSSSTPGTACTVSIVDQVEETLTI